jgi:DNA (cytosine-5)-methyltransferase 1
LVEGTYFNEIDAGASAWLRELYPDAAVDERSIADVAGPDVVGFRRCHYFGGIGGWEYALHLAGWPDDDPVWTGSCPCQPFSSAGKRKGVADERHLWPEFLRLIAECRPPVVLGEQVASRAGRGWLAGVRADLEALGYAVGAADLCAAGSGSPHIRQRLWWVAHSGGNRLEGSRKPSGTDEGREAEVGRGQRSPVNGRAVRLGDSRQSRLAGRPGEPGDDGPQRPPAERAGGDAGGLADPGEQRCDRREGVLRDWGNSAERSQASGDAGDDCGLGFWSRYDLIPCRDGKARRVEPGTFPLAHGVPGRVGLLRGYGNAIVPQVAATFIRAFREATGGQA